MSVRELHPQPLTAEAFRPFGDVLETLGAGQLVNDGTTRQFADLARVSAGAGGRVRVGIYRVVPYDLPLAIRMLERHPLGSQLFMPLHGEPFLVVVAPAAERVDPAQVCAFVSNGRQGVNYLPGTWHHPVIALRETSEFLVVDRGGDAHNCDESLLDEGIELLAPSPRE